MCGTMAAGWVDGEHPEVEGETVDRVVYFDFDNNSKYNQAPVKITHCGDYFVYFLEEAPEWDLGYCTTHQQYSRLQLFLKLIVDQ